MRGKTIDKTFLTSVLLLLGIGVMIFISASMGLLAREGASFKSVVFDHIFFGVFIGSIAMFITSRLNYKLWKKFALPLFIFSLIATLLVFVPHLGFRYNGARRWIVLAGFSFQPAEFLKIGFLVFLAAWFSSVKDKIKTFKHGTLPLLIISGIAGAIMIAQPDNTTFMVMFFAGVVMFLVGGGRFWHILLVGLGAALVIAILAFTRPYVMQRITTFINPADDPQGAGYQIQQSLIAIGSGQVTGRGFGQSIQKFYFLPEPIGDSIFAVAGEEFGFIGAASLILLFVFFAMRGFKIAASAPDSFGGLLTVGIVILVMSQSFINIGAMLGVLPLSGLPLIFVSHGGTALLFALAEVGIIFNISRYQKA